MKRLTAIPAWAELQQFNFKGAPVWLKALCSGKGIKFFARRGNGSNQIFVVWNKSGCWEIKEGDRN